MNKKIKNGDKPIAPTILRQVGDNEFRIASERDIREGIFLTSEIGVTKREYFAAMAMQGLLVNYIDNGMYGNSTDYPMVSEQSVRMADELLKQLDNEKDYTQTYQAFKGELIQDEIGNLKPKKNEQ